MKSWKLEAIILVKYVLEKGYRMYKDHVVCEAEYHPAFGLIIDEEWDEF